MKVVTMKRMRFFPESEADRVLQSRRVWLYCLLGVNLAVMVGLIGVALANNVLILILTLVVHAVFTIVSGCSTWGKQADSFSSLKVLRRALTFSENQ